MADIHILEIAGDKVRMAFHFPIADVNNDAAVSLRTALVNSGLGGTTALTEGTGPGQIATAEKTQIQAGEVFEEIVSLVIEQDGAASDAARLQIAKDHFLERQSELTSEIPRKLRYYGWSGSAT